ncbi:MAG: UDP-N-acetylglucosamine 2-epimerase (non-hydrolyzing), partial [Chloroflexi bacterium]|nr:UDP-N-acetylglucosamine 2-epimerase (non-hydrolyzing) [Chloroflexota bacterium]
MVGNNTRLKILAVCGTRPDTVKMAPVVGELKKHPEEVDLVLAVTGQHREMLVQVLEAFDMHPDYDLNIMSARQTLTH